MNRRSLVILGLMLLVLSCASPDGAPEAEQTENAAMLENGSFRAELNGFGIHYEVHGTGPVVMTVTNSWGFDIDGLRAVYGLLEDRLTMVYFDPRGMGESDPVREDADMGMAAVRADFDALRAHLGLERVHAIGWSNGATNLIMLAAEHPETLDSAIFLHGAASYSQEDQARFAEEHPQLIETFVRYQKSMDDPELPDARKDEILRQIWLTGLFPASCADPEWGRRELPRLFEAAEFSWRHGIHAGQEAPTIDLLDRLPLIRARSLVLAGAHDTMPLAKAEEMRDGIDGAELVVFEESGHFAPLEEPERFREVVFAFLGVD